MAHLYFFNLLMLHILFDRTKILSTTYQDAFRVADQTLRKIFYLN